MKFGKSFSIGKYRITLRVLAACLIPLSFVFNSIAIDNRPKVEIQDTSPSLTEVDVLQIASKTHIFQLKGHSQVQPKYEIDVIALSGVVVNNSLLIVSFYNELRNSGVLLYQAISQACGQRLRAIFSTST